MYQYADIYLLQRQTLHVSGVTALILRSSKICPFGMGHGIGTATSFHQIRPRWKEVAVPIPWPISEVADTVFCFFFDGRCDARNM
jgi:hypothetical protein